MAVKPDGTGSFAKDLAQRFARLKALRPGTPVAGETWNWSRERGKRLWGKLPVSKDIAAA